MPPLILASASPRRAELLRQIGVAFTVHASDFPEDERPGEDPADYVRRLACGKAGAVAEHVGRGPVVLGADTVVVVDGTVLGKPGNRALARAMLAKLAGREHRVLTAVAVAAAGVTDVALSDTAVWFRAIDTREADAYDRTEEGLDKAGGYAIQGAAAAFVERIEGSYSGVVGLPLCETSMMLRRAGVAVMASRT